MGEAVLHVVLEVDAAGRAGAVVLGGGGAAGQVVVVVVVAGVGGGGGAAGEAGVRVGGDAGDGGDGVVALGGRHGVLAVGRVLVALAGDVDGHGVAYGVERAGHDGQADLVCDVACGVVLGCRWEDLGVWPCVSCRIR